MKRNNTASKINFYITLISIITVISVVFLSIAYSSFSATATIENTMASFRLQADARITGISFYNANGSGESSAEGYNANNIYGTINLPTSSSTVTYKVSATVFLGSEMKISGISGLPSNLDYELTNYTLGDVLCNSNNECNYGATDEFYVTIKYKTNGYDSSGTIYPFTLNFTFERVDFVARIGSTRYPSLQAAVNAVPTNNVETTVMLLQNSSELISVSANQNIVFNFQGNTLSNDGVNPVISNYGTIKFIAGTITSDTTQGAVNNEAGGHFIVNGGHIITTGTKQAIYNNGGTLEVMGSSYLSSTSNQRGTITNLASGVATITGGTIISTRYEAVNNAATLIIGTKDGNIDNSSPILQGYTYGIKATTNYSFYDGTIKGKTAALADETMLSDIETGKELIHSVEKINGVNYNVVHLGIAANVIFNPNGGSVSEPTRELEKGTVVGQLPIPTRTDYEFLGWFTDPTNGTEISESEIINADVEFFAHWIYKDDVVSAEIGNTTYTTLQAAINAVPKNNTKTTITVKRNISEVLSIVANQNIVLVIGNYKISNKGTSPVITNRGTLEINDGTITSNATQGAINNENSAHLKMTGGQIIATGTRQAIYNSGTVEISGTAYLSAETSERAPLHNLANGVVIITGGTIVSKALNAVENLGTLTIGVKDGTLNNSSPLLRGNNYGVNNTGTFNFYDGLIEGENAAINGTVTDIEQNSTIINSAETINGVVYQTAYLGNN